MIERRRSNTRCLFTKPGEIDKTKLRSSFGKWRNQHEHLDLRKGHPDTRTHIDDRLKIFVTKRGEE